MMKIFTVAVVLTIVGTVTVANGAIDSKLDDVDYIMEDFPTTRSLCPPNVTSYFDVIFNVENSSTVKGCAYLDFVNRNELTKLEVFRVRFGRLNNSGPRVCVTGEYAGMEQLTFSCKSRSASKQLKFDNSEVYTAYGIVIKPAAAEHQTRCVLYKMTKSVMTMMAVSSNTSCEGLSRMKILSKALEGSSSLRLNRFKDDLRHRRSTSEDRNSTQLNFSGSRFFWRTG